MVAVAGLTYLLVFNINTIVDSVRQFYIARKQKIIDAMVRDPSSEKWEEIGQHFQKFNARNSAAVIEPSEWRIIYYALVHALPDYLLETFRSQEDTADENIQPDPETPSTRANSGYLQEAYRRLFSRRGGPAVEQSDSS